MNALLEEQSNIIKSCRRLLSLYPATGPRRAEIPEDVGESLHWKSDEQRLSFYSLPTSLNYRRDSGQLWRAAVASHLDPETAPAFDIEFAAQADERVLRDLLVRHRLAYQPKRHVENWLRISSTVRSEWGSFSELILGACNSDYLLLREAVQHRWKASFPYLSGPKLFNFWCLLLVRNGQVNLKNFEAIEIAVDSRVRESSRRLGVISDQESRELSAPAVAERWRKLLADTAIAPAELSVPLWHWSRDGYPSLSKELIEGNA